MVEDQFPKKRVQSIQDLGKSIAVHFAPEPLNATMSGTLATQLCVPFLIEKPLLRGMQAGYISERLDRLQNIVRCNLIFLAATVGGLFGLWLHARREPAASKADAARPTPA